MASNRAEIGTPMDGYRTWQVADVYSNGAPFKFTSSDVVCYSVGRWSGDGWVIFTLRGMVVRGPSNKMRIFRSPQGAARAAEALEQARVAAVREVNEAQSASDSRAVWPSHDREAT